MFDLADTDCSMARFHKILSLLLHPMLTCTWSALIILCSPIGKVLLMLLQPSAFWILPGIVFAFTFLMPTLIITGVCAALRKKNDTENQDHSVTITFTISILFMVVSYYLLKDIAIAIPLNLYLLSAISTCILTMMLKPFWNISYYTAAWGNLSGLLFYLCLSMPHIYLSPFLGIILISGAVGWNRLATLSHRHGEIYAGYALGFATTAVLFATLL